MLREGALSISYHIHEMGPLSEPPSSPTQSSSQPRTMPLLMTAGCAADSSGQLSSGPSGYRFTKFIGGGLLSSPLDGQPDALQQAPAATTVLNTLFPCSSRQEILLEELSLATGTHAQLMNMNSGSSFQSAEADVHNAKRSGTSAGSSQLRNNGRGTGDPEKDGFLYNQLRTATSAGIDDRNTVNCVDGPLNEAAGEWGGAQQPSLIMTELSMIPYQDGRCEKIRPEAPASHESECTPDHQLGSTRSVFLSDGRIAKDEQHSTFNHQLHSEHNDVINSAAESARDAYSSCETVAQSQVPHAFPSYSINMLSANPFNFPTGAELLGVPTQLQQSSSHPSRGGSVSNGVPDHASESGPFGNVGAVYPDQNLASRLGAYTNTPPSLKGSWTDMASNQYANSSLLAQGNHTVGQSNLQAMSRIVGAPAGPSILSDGLQENHYSHEEPARNRDGASYFPPQQTEAVDHAMQLCLSFVVPDEDSEPAVTEPRFHRFRGPLQGQRAQLLSPQGIPAVSGQHMSGSQGYDNNWRNGGNELLFIPGSDSTVDTEPFTGQMTDQFQQQAELGISLYGSRRSPTSVNQLHHDSIFQNSDGHAGGHDSQFQGLSLSLSSEQLPSHHGRTHEADIDVFAIMSQATAEAKGKRVQECTEGRYNGILSRFRPQRDDQDLALPETAQRVYHYGQSVGAKLEGKQSLLLYPNPDPYLPSSSNIPYGTQVSGSRYLTTNQVLLNNLCTVTKCKKSTGDHLKSQCSNWNTQSDFSTFNVTGANGMGADSDTRKDFMMSIASLLPCSSSSPMGETRAREVAFQKHAQSESREALESKKILLRTCLDQVDRRYRTYNELMRDVINHFNSVAGPEAAIPYTALAMQTMSRQFRRVRDNICGYLRAVKRALGEEETSPDYAGRDLSSLRFVDQQLRQQRTMQQLGMLQQHAWRPQRGLPERAVSVLRSWLFEHFLHPYPKDSDKHFLAKQTGLTRSQVSNWFINARVRLWKPMVEEMYLDEFNHSDEGGSGERRNSRELRREHEAVEYDDANIVASSFSNGHAESGAVDNQQRITIACGGDSVFNPPSNMRTAHGCTQNGSNSNNLSDFDGDQRGGILKKARNGIHNCDRLAGMDIDSVSPGSFHGSSRLEGSYDNSAANQDYSQHQDILAAANGGRFAAYLGGNLTGYPGDGGGFVSQATASTNGGVSLTLGLRYSDGLSLPGTAAPQPKYGNHDDAPVRNMNNVHSELPLAHLNPGQEAQDQRNRPTSHLFHEFVSQG